MQGSIAMFIGRVSAAVQADRLALKHIVPELDESVVIGVNARLGVLDER